MRTFDQQVIVVGVAREDELEWAGWWTAANSNPIHCSHHSQTACPVWLAEVWVTHPSYEHIWLRAHLFYIVLCALCLEFERKKVFFLPARVCCVPKSKMHILPRLLIAARIFEMKNSWLIVRGEGGQTTKSRSHLLGGLGILSRGWT